MVSFDKSVLFFLLGCRPVAVFFFFFYSVVCSLLFSIFRNSCSLFSGVIAVMLSTIFPEFPRKEAFVSVFEQNQTSQQQDSVLCLLPMQQQS